MRDNLARIPGSPDLLVCQKIFLLGSKKILQDALTRHEKEKVNALISFKNKSLFGDLNNAPRRNTLVVK